MDRYSGLDDLDDAPKQAMTKVGSAWTAPYLLATAARQSRALAREAQCSSRVYWQVERVGIGSTFVKQAQDAKPHIVGDEPTAVSRIEIVPSRREVKRAAAVVAMPPPPPAAKAAAPPPSASGYKAPPWASSPPAGALFKPSSKP